MREPPEVFSLPVVRCPACTHGVDPHGTDPGGQCGVGEYDEATGIDTRCPCMWSPNDIAATLVAGEREEMRDRYEGMMRALTVELLHARREERERLARDVEGVAHAPACPGGAGCWCPVGAVLRLAKGDDGGTA